MENIDPYSAKPGDYFLGQISGFTGFLIRVGQLLCGDASRYTHAGVVLDDGTVVEAEPGGARITPLSEIERDDEPVAFSRFPLTDDQRAAIVKAARGYEGTPYSFLDYLSIALETLHLGFGWTKKRVQSSGHMICSQLVDQSYQDAGIHLFEDGRFPGDVTPGDLAYVGSVWNYKTGPYVE